MRIAVIGPLEVLTDDGVPTAVPGAKERLLLAVLTASAPGAVSTDRLVEAMWDGAPPVTARKSLQAHVVRLRSALEPDRPPGSAGRYVVRRGTGYVLTLPRGDLDVLAFGDLASWGRAHLASGDAAEARRLLTAALDLWRGEPYGDWPDAAFADGERRRLAEVREGAVTALLETRLALGEHADALPDLERLIADDPLQEERWRLLALALYRCGRQGDALAAVRRARRVLAEDLGADPGPRLRAMEAALLAQDPALDGPGVAPPRPAGGARQPDVAVCPYKGLATYEAADAALFHGRDRVVAHLVGRLVDAPVAVVSGPSGAGKSSLVRAGLVPALTGGALPGSGAWRAVVVTPGRRPVDALAGLTGQAPPAEPVVLVCDQTEELWAPGMDAAERTAFLDTVLGLVQDGVAVRCVLVLRADHVGRLAEHAAFAEVLGSALVLVPALGEQDLRTVVGEPARSVGLTVDPELEDTVVADVLGRPGALPLLSTALVGTWERRRGNRLTLAGYLEAGGVAGALARSAEDVYASLEGEEREAAHRLLVRLADAEEGGVLVRRPQPLVELDLDGEQGGRRRAVVDAFVARRLLAVDGEYLDVAHEALFTAWPRLARWLDDDAAGRAVRRHLAPAAQDWLHGGEREDELYRGARLAAALDWAAGPDADLTQVERRFLAASQARADAELTAAHDRARSEAAARTRTRRLARGLAAMLVLALVGGGLAVRAQRAAEEASTVADAHRLAALSTTVGSLDVSLLLAAQAVRLADTPEAQDGLLAALATHGRAQRAVPFGGEAQGAWLGGGGRILFLGVGPRFEAWRIGPSTQPRPILDIPFDWGGLTGFDASPTGNVLMVTGGEESLPWVRRVLADGTSEAVLHGGRALGGFPVGGAFDAGGEWFHVLLATPGDAPGGGSTFRVVDVHPVDGTVRPTGTAGGHPAPPGSLRADFADDGGSFVLWDSGLTAPATLVDLSGGGTSPLRPQPGSVAPRTYRAVPPGVAQLDENGGVTLYDGRGDAVQHLDVHQEAVHDVVVSPDGTWAVTTGAGPAVVVWDVDGSTGRWSQRESLAGHDGAVVSAVVDPSGGRLYTVGRDNTVIAWDMGPGGGFGAAYRGLGDRWIVAPPALVDPDGPLVAPTRPGSFLGDRPGARRPDTTTVAATFLDPLTGDVLDEVVVGDTGSTVGFSASVAVSPDRRMVAITWGLGVTVLDTRTRQVVARIEPQASGVWSAGWTPDGSRLLLGMQGSVPGFGPGQVAVLDTATWQIDDVIDIDGSAQVTEAGPDGRLLAVASTVTPTLVVLDAETLAVERTVPLGATGLVLDLSFSPDGGLLAAGTESGLLHVLDTGSWNPVREPATVHDGRVLQVEWLDPRTAVTAGDDGRVSLVDVERGLLRARPMPSSSEQDPGYTHAVPLPGQLVVLHGDRAGRRYPMDPAVWLDQACDVAGRDLTRSEWARYLPDRDWEPTCSDRP